MEAAQSPTPVVASTLAEAPKPAAAAAAPPPVEQQTSVIKCPWSADNEAEMEEDERAQAEAQFEASLAAGRERADAARRDKGLPPRDWKGDGGGGGGGGDVPPSTTDPLAA